MDRADTVAAVQTMLGTFADDTSEATWDAVLARSVIPDTAGRWPGSAGYVDFNYDPDWAAAELVSGRLLQTMTTDTLVEWASEGSRFKFSAAELAALERKLRDRSWIGRCSGQTLESLTIPTDRINFDTRSDSWPGNPGRQHVITNRD